MEMIRVDELFTKGESLVRKLQVYGGDSQLCLKISVPYHRMEVLLWKRLPSHKLLVYSPAPLAPEVTLGLVISYGE